MVIGVGAAGGVTGAGDALGSTGAVGFGATGAVGSTGTVGVVPASDTPTTRSSICSSEVSVPIVETGIFVPPSDSWPDGRVRLLAVRTPLIWATLTPLSASLVGSSVMSRRCSRPPVTSARDTPSMAVSSGMISSRAIVGGGLQAVLRGRGDRGDDDRRGVDVERLGGRVDALGQAGVGDALLDGGQRFLDVGAVLELGDDQGDRVGRGRLDGLQPGHAGDGLLDRAPRPCRRRPASRHPGTGRRR